MSKTERLWTILGPTACGKTELAVALARELNGEIISADSRQVYRDMDIGTGKDLDAYGLVPYHLIDIRNAGEDYNIEMYRHDFNRVLQDICMRNKAPVLCGGSGLYLQAVLQNFTQTSIPQDAALREKLQLLSNEALQDIFQKIVSGSRFRHNGGSRKQMIRAIEMDRWLQQNPMPHNPYTVPTSVIFGLNPATDQRRKNISDRLQQRLNAGLIEEVERLIGRGIAPERLMRYGLEYKWVCLYLQGVLSYEDFFKHLETAIHRFAKRQMTYFRKMEKDGLKIHWLKSSALADRLSEVLKKQNEFS